jgi:hypothetical protein
MKTHSQGKFILLDSQEFDNFPSQFEIVNKVFQHYYDLAFPNGKIESLNVAQKALCYHFICNGMIGNSGFFAIFLETLGKYNTGYLETLVFIEDKVSEKIWKEIISIYEKYENWFGEQINPPVLNEDSEEYDEELENKIENLQKAWYNNELHRKTLFEQYLLNNKNLLIKKKD